MNVNDENALQETSWTFQDVATGQAQHVGGVWSLDCKLLRCCMFTQFVICHQGAPQNTKQVSCDAVQTTCQHEMSLSIPCYIEHFVQYQTGRDTTQTRASTAVSRILVQAHRQSQTNNTLVHKQQIWNVSRQQAAGYSACCGHARQRRLHSTNDCSHAASYRCSSSATVPQAGHPCPSSTLHAERGDCMPSMDSAAQY